MEMICLLIYPRTLTYNIIRSDTSLLNISRRLALEENFVEFSDYAKMGGVWW